jgi:hypothetical protein
LTVLNTLFSMLGIIPHFSAVLYNPVVGINFGLMCVWLALGSLVAWKPAALARSMLPKPSSPTAQKKTWDLDEFQAVLFSVVGIYLVVTQLTDLGGWWRAWSYLRQSSGPRSWLDHEAAAIGTIVLRLVAGVWLLFGARGLIGAIRRLRRMGTT